MKPLVVLLLVSVVVVPRLSAEPSAERPEIEPRRQGLVAADYATILEEARTWVEELRTEHRPQARALSGVERQRFSPFFPPEVLERARVRVVPGIVNPRFYRIFRERGLPDPIDFSAMSGLAVEDTVLVVRAPGDLRGSRSNVLLFHELVHVTQWAVLGDGYLRDYVEGWAETGSYRRIPAEVQAYELAARFRLDSETVFSVEEEVRDLAARRRTGGEDDGD